MQASAGLAFFFFSTLKIQPRIPRLRNVCPPRGAGLPTQIE